MKSIILLAFLMLGSLLTAQTGDVTGLVTEEGSRVQRIPANVKR